MNTHNIIHRGYVPNIAVDMTVAALKHYKQYQRPVDSIILAPHMWEKFKAGILQLSPEKEDDINMTNQVEFKDCIVKRGSNMMIKSMIVTLKERVLA